MPGQFTGLAEIALRARDLDAMTRFYADVVGLQLLERFNASAFFRISDGTEGLTQMLVLFDGVVEPYSVRQPLTEPRVEANTLHHLALAIPLAVLPAERDRLKQLGCSVTEASHDWAHVRSLYVNDPEGNVVEWVAYDPTV